MSQTTKVHELSAAELRSAFASRELSPREALSAARERIDETNRALNAFWKLDDAAEAAAAAAERRYAVGEARPLDGLPLGVKDLFDTAGCETTYGSPMFTGNVPLADAEAVRRLRAAGAVVVGKTSTDEFAYGITSNNPHFGAVHNPWDVMRVSGGSSGGSAAALAAGQVPLALGSDTGGSIRAPAAFCGIVGFKPTWGVVPGDGLFPMARSLDHPGPMARTPADAALLFEILTGRSIVLRPELAGVRIGVCSDLELVPLQADIAATWRRALDLLEEIGAVLVEVRLPDAADLFPTFLPIQQAETAWTHRRLGLYPQRAAEYSDDVRTRLKAASNVTLDDYQAALDSRESLRWEFDDLFAQVDLLVTPLAATSPAPLGTSDIEDAMRESVMFFTVPQDLLGLPACAVRAGFDTNGLPVGIQIVGPAHGDELVLSAAAYFYAATPSVQVQWPLLPLHSTQPEGGSK